MNFYLVEPNYYKLRLIVKASSKFSAVRIAAKWIQENKHVYIMLREFEAEIEYFPLQIKDAIWI